MAATSNSPTRAAVAALLAIVVAATIVASASASTLTVFEGPECSGKKMDVNGCGCFNITGYQGGFHFVYTEGQAANLYCGANCACRFSPTHLNVETRSCVANDFKGVDMFC